MQISPRGLHGYLAANIRTIRRFLFPSLGEFNKRPFKCYVDPDLLLKEIVDQIRYTQSLEKIASEFQTLKIELLNRYKQAHSHSDNVLGSQLDENASKLVYFLVRLSRPKVVLETGVANGESTYYILNAIIKNKCGRLYSTDVSSHVGGLLNAFEKDNWSLTILRNGNKKVQFINMLNDIGAVNIYLHDSDHSYGWQKFEYQAVIRHMDKNHSLFISDDVDYSYAFLELVDDINSKPLFLIGKNKVLGVFEVV